MSDLFSVSLDAQGGIVLKTNDRDLVADVAESLIEEVPFKSLEWLRSGLRHPSGNGDNRLHLPDATLVLARMTTAEARELAMELLNHSGQPTVLVPLLKLVMSE